RLDREPLARHRGRPRRASGRRRRETSLDRARWNATRNPRSSSSTRAARRVPPSRGRCCCASASAGPSGRAPATGGGACGPRCAGLAGLFATGFTITILAVSLGDVARDLGASETALTWTVTGPFLALALSMPLFGKIGDVRGHRRVYLAGLAGFTIATFLTAFA